MQLINHLGVKLGNEPERILDRLDRDAYTEADIDYSSDRVASDHHYAHDVRQTDADTPGRFNADPKRLFEASGSAGKVMIFAVRLDTFPKEKETKVFYIGTNDPAELAKNPPAHSRALQRFAGVEGEYLHRVCFDISAKYGKDTFPGDPPSRNRHASEVIRPQGTRRRHGQPSGPTRLQRQTHANREPSVSATSTKANDGVSGQIRTSFDA